jgi:ribosomal protein L34E
MPEQQHFKQQSGGQHRCSKCNQTFNSAEEQRTHEQEHHKHEGNPSEQHKEHTGVQRSNR